MEGETFWSLLIKGDFWNFFVQIFNFYFPYGMFFWILGFVIFLIVELKTKSLGFASIVAITYFVLISSVPGLVVNVYSRIAMRYIGIIGGLIIGYYLYKAVRGSRY